MKRLVASTLVGVGALLLGNAGPVVAAQAPVSITRELIPQSDFIGFCWIGSPMGSSDTGEWRQFYSPAAYPTSVESIKGSLPRDPAGTLYPWIAFDHQPATSYPTWLPADGEYLVFLKQGLREGQNSWNTIAAFPVLYRTDAAGNVTGAIYGDGEEYPRISRDQVRVILKGASGDTAPGADVRLLDAILRNAMAATSRPGYRQPVPHEQRLAEVLRLVATIRPGTTRVDVEKILTTEDGGLFSGTTRYVMGSEVMAEVPYDTAGGGMHKPGNKVLGPIKVYRDRPHYD